MLEHKKCVVLNGTYEPLDIVSAKKAITLISKGKAQLVEQHADGEVRSGSQTMGIPSTVLLNYVVRAKRIYNVPAQLNNRNLFIRDGETCQYCGTHKNKLKNGTKLSRDHIIPRDLGGKDIWMNVITACEPCNNKKANMRLSESGMRLMKDPHVPTVFEIISKGPWGRRLKGV